MAERNFLGTGLKFPPEIDKATGHFKTVSGEEAVKESIYLILMTQRSERFVRPFFGSDIMSYTFMDTGETMLSIFRRNITQTILEQEPRVSDVAVDTEFVEKQGVVIVSVNYVVSSTNTRDNLVFPFYLNTGEETQDENGLEPDAQQLGPSYYDEYGNEAEVY
ncbi:MAG: GPW/gp25 family protein [Lachnospiraceae bacterium]|nr:GPW/gp25 family protein [Lachnospiraceae bacterium]